MSTASILLFHREPLVFRRPFSGAVYVRHLDGSSLTMNNFYIGSGADFTGVPSKMLNLNGMLKIGICNPATFYGIHVSTTSVNLIYSDISVANVELKSYYQSRKSHKSVLVQMEGTKVPIYSAGSNLAFTGTAIQVPLTLEFEIISKGDVVGKLERTKDRRRASCPLIVDSSSNKPIKFKKDSCTYT